MAVCGAIFVAKKRFSELAMPLTILHRLHYFHPHEQKMA